MLKGNRKVAAPENGHCDHITRVLERNTMCRSLMRRSQLALFGVPAVRADRVVQSSRLGLPLLIEGQLLSQEQDLRDQGRARAEERRKKRSPSAIRSVIKLSRKCSERFAFGKNRNMGCQDGTRSVRPKGIYCSQDWFLGFPSERMPNK
jgi:hypothetical protein